MKFCIFKIQVEKETCQKLLSLKKNKSREFLLQKFQDFCEKNGIRRWLTQVLTSQQNDVERHNKIIVEKGRSLLYDNKLPSNLWLEGFNTINYLVNLYPISDNNKKYSFKLYYKKKPKI